MKSLSIKNKITAIVAIVVTIGFALMVVVSLKSMETKVTDAMISQFINENTQIAKQASIILEKGGKTDELQSFVTDLADNNDYIAYAVVVDKDVTAIAHSDTQKIGKSYADDTAYTVPAAQEGKVMTSKFWADVQKAWTYDVMCPINVNGTLYGAMDIGIYNSTVGDTIAKLRLIQSIIAVTVIILSCIIIALFVTIQLKPLHKIAELCNIMGTGDFTTEISKKDLKRKDEVGLIAEAMNTMQTNLSALIMTTEHHTQKLLTLSDTLTENANNTRTKASDILDKSDVAVSGTEQQTDLTHRNIQMTEEIAKSMEDIAENITNITSVSSETAKEADMGSDKINVIVDQMTKIEENVNGISDKIQDLAKMSDGIQNVVHLIGDIATQTNLLSLNASIEAARAGLSVFKIKN